MVDPTIDEKQAAASGGAMPMLSITPTPSDEEVAAVMAAMEALWPRPVVDAEPTTRRNAAWRFSGRWWSLPVPVRRGRPWH